MTGLGKLPVPRVRDAQGRKCCVPIPYTLHWYGRNVLVIPHTLRRCFSVYGRRIKGVGTRRNRRFHTRKANNDLSAISCTSGIRLTVDSMSIGNNCNEEAFRHYTDEKVYAGGSGESEQENKASPQGGRGETDAGREQRCGGYQKKGRSEKSFAAQKIQKKNTMVTMTARTTTARNVRSRSRTILCADVVSDRAESPRTADS